MYENLNEQKQVWIGRHQISSPAVNLLGISMWMGNCSNICNISRTVAADGMAWNMDDQGMLSEVPNLFLDWRPWLRHHCRYECADRPGYNNAIGPQSRCWSILADLQRCVGLWADFPGKDAMLTFKICVAEVLVARSDWIAVVFETHASWMLLVRLTMVGIISRCLMPGLQSNVFTNRGVHGAGVPRASPCEDQLL